MGGGGGAETGQMSKKHKKFEVRKSKYIEIGDYLMDVKFLMGIFGRISEY